MVTYGSYEADAMEKEQELANRGTGDFLRLEVGANIVRFLPPMAGVRSPFVLVHEHFVTIGENKVRFACPKQMAGTPCPACARADKLRGTGNQADYKKAGMLWPKLRAYSNAIDYKNPIGPKILSLNKSTYNKIREIRSTVGDFTHPETGFPFNIKRTGTALDTEYLPIHLAPSRLENFDWLEMQHDLARYALVEPLDSIMARLKGGGDSPKQVPQFVAPQRTMMAAVQREESAQQRLTADFPDDEEDNLPF